MSDSPLWSLQQRLIHWGLVTGLGMAWWSAESQETLHEWTGYAIVALVGWRVVLGFVQKGAADWGVLMERIAQLPAYLSKRGQAPTAAGHTPAGAASVLLLLGLTLATAITGWMLTLESFAGDEAAEWRHELAFRLLQGWVVLHVLAVLLQSRLQRRNLIQDMIRGGQATR